MTEGERGTFGLTKYYFFENIITRAPSTTSRSPSLPEGGYCNARSPEKIIVCVFRLLRNVGMKFQSRPHLISRGNGLTNASLREGGGIRVNLNE